MSTLLAGFLGGHWSTWGGGGVAFWGFAAVLDIRSRAEVGSKFVVAASPPHEPDWHV